MRIESRPAIPPVLVAIFVVAMFAFASLAFQVGRQIDAHQRATASQKQQRAATKAILNETAGARPLGHDL